VQTTVVLLPCLEGAASDSSSEGACGSASSGLQQAPRSAGSEPTPAAAGTSCTARGYGGSFGGGWLAVRPVVAAVGQAAVQARAVAVLHDLMVREPPTELLEQWEGMGQVLGRMFGQRK
jgi:hypothetical protein